MRSDSLKLPHITSNFLMVIRVAMVMVVMDRTGQDRTGQARTKLYFPGNL